MKTLLLILVCLMSVCLSLYPVYGQEEKEVLKSYEAVTGDLEVSSKDDVVVEEIVIVERRVPWTLKEIESTIDYYKFYVGYYEDQLKVINDEIAKMEKLKEAIEKEASTVELSHNGASL